MWGVFLSEPLDIVAMVGRCPAIKLMSREPIRYRRTFQLKAMQPQVVWDISRRFHRLSPCIGQVAHVLRTLPPVAVRVLLLHAAPRLACVKPAASVHPEPGSNSSLYISLYLKFNPALLISKKLTLSIFLCLVLASLYFRSSLFNELRHTQRLPPLFF